MTLNIMSRAAFWDGSTLILETLKPKIIFYNSDINDDAKIVLNYTESTLNLVDNIISYKGSSNIVKGELIQ